jgi:beta-lactamase class A
VPISQWIRRHRQVLQQIGIGIGAAALFSMIVQLAYPPGRLLPFVKVENQEVGGKTTLSAKKQLDDAYKNAQVTVKTDKKTFNQSLQEIGLDVQTWETAKAAAHYPIGERFIPFSSVAIMIARNTAMRVSADDDRLNYFAQQVEKEAFVPAIDASIKLDGDTVKLKPSESSKAYPAKSVASVLKAVAYTPKTTVNLQPQTKPAGRTDEQVNAVLNDAQKAVDTQITLNLGTEKISVTKQEVASWLDLKKEDNANKLQVNLNADAVKKYLGTIQSKIYKEPGTTHVRIIDGREAGRTEGEPGKGIDADKTVVALSDAIKKGEKTTVDVPIAQLAPKVVYDKQYSDGGLSALLADLSASNGFGISVIDVNGTRSGSANGGKSFQSASTYKLFIAYAVFKQIDAGQMQWTDIISNGRNADTCFEVMIVNSDNPCAKAFGDKIGWQKVEDMAHGLGFTATQLTPSLSTTANDLSLYLYKLQNGSLLPADQRDKLLSAMQRQIYRSGIPAGTGLRVADKVGFVDNVIHDAAIVYGPKGPYVLVVMTSNSSWSNIASVARQVNAFMNR